MKNTLSGLTLLEVLVAIAIFGLLSIAILGMYPNIFKTNSQTRNDQALTILAKQYLERVQVEYIKLTESNKTAVPKVELNSFKNYSIFKPTSTEDLKKLEVNGYQCRPRTSDQEMSGSTVLILRVELKCTRTNFPEYKFWIDLGRPV